MSSAGVRAFTASDVGAANALTNHFIEHSAVHFAYEPATDAAFHELWTKGAADYPWLVADVDGAFVGYAKASRWRERAAYARTVETTVYLGPGHHGRGVGRQLYGSLLDELCRRGFRTAIGGITLPNDGSVRLHEGLGFRHVGTFRNVGHKFGRWHDVGFWQIDFEAAAG
ncbi:MAG: N-acetyltransferase family protein [Planctomycetota bacterium]